MYTLYIAEPIQLKPYEGFEMKSVAPDELDRTVIIGNTASGKSWLSKQLGQRLSLHVVDLDQIRWIDGDYSRKETAAVAIKKTCQHAQGERWIIEGVYGWLVRPIIARATCLIWTDIPWAESRRNLFERETASGPKGNFKELETWSEDYWSRESSSSYGAHLKLFEDFTGSKHRLRDMSETSRFTDHIS